MNRDQEARCKTLPDDGGLDPVERRIILATQAGLPLAEDPYEVLAEELGLDVNEVLARIGDMQQRGVIRRIAAVPNHYALGYRVNGMSVWNVVDEQVHALGTKVGALDYVSHCYLRPRHLPLWPYNLFAMVHGKTRDEVAVAVAAIATLLGEHCRGHEVLYSKRILKKTGLRLRDDRGTIGAAGTLK
jgi:DNA-binding Lrp family transcriptional regulator